MLTRENYFSLENNLKYMGSSQFKEFLKCEERAIARIRGFYKEEQTTALLVGSYVDSHFSNSLDIFKAQHPQIFTQQGRLKADYTHAEYIIQRIERDELFMQYMSGEKQVIYTGEIEGVPFKILIDSDFPDKIVDMKIMKDFDTVWVEGRGRVNFVEAWGYDIQAAIYSTIKGDALPFIIAAATKEKEPDLGLFEIPPDAIRNTMENIIKPNVVRFHQLKQGIIKPNRCESCDWCRLTRKLDKVIDYREMG